MDLVLAVEIEKDRARVGLVNRYGEVEAKFYVDHDESNLVNNLYDKVIDKLNAIGIDYETRIEKIGVVVAGYIDHVLGIVRYSANLDLKDYNVIRASEEVFKKPTFVINDANASALGEFWIGAASQYDSIIFYYIDKGIGGAVISEGKLTLGFRGYAGEFGHGGGIYQSQYDCPCGLKGCIEPISSICGIENHFKTTFRSKNDCPAAKYFKDIDAINWDLILKVYEENNYPIEITQLLSEALSPIIMHMALMINSLDPEAIVLAGDLTKLGPHLVRLIEKKIKNYIIDFFSEDLTIEIAELGPDSTLIGSAYYAINDWKLF